MTRGFLKEESSGSRQVIEYYLDDENEVIEEESGDIYLKGKFPDGSYCQLSQDIINLFISSPIISFHTTNDVFYCSPSNVHEIENNALMYLYVDASKDNTTIYMISATLFDQIKQSKS